MMMSEIDSNRPTYRPETSPSNEQHEEDIWLDHGLIALECLQQIHAYQIDEAIATNNFLKLVHASRLQDPGIVTYKAQIRDARELADQSEKLARYNVAIAIGIEADDPTLPESGGSLNIQSPVHRGYLDKVFWDFRRNYDNQEVGGHIKKIREGQEELKLPPRIDAESESTAREVAQPYLPEEMTGALDKWLNQLKDKEQASGGTETLFDKEQTPVRAAIRTGSLYLLAAQAAISLKNRRDTYDPLLHGRTAPKGKSEDQISPPKPEEELRESLRQFPDDYLVQFADTCILRGAEFIPVLREAGLLPDGYPDNQPDKPEATIGQYRRQFSAPSDQVREKHRKDLRKAVSSPKINFKPSPRNQSESQGQQEPLF